MSIQQHLEQFDRDGYVLIEGFFSEALTDALERLSHAHFGDDPAFGHSEEFLQLSQTDVIPWFPQRDGETAFDEVDENRVLAQLTAGILGKGWQRQYCMVMFSKPGSLGQAWHQDCPPEGPQAFNLNRLVYTRDIDATTGGEVVVVPGSHRRGLLPAGDPAAAIDGELRIRPAKGALLLLHGHAWHRVLPIVDKPRLSINYRAAPQDVREDITDVGVYRNMLYRFSTAEVLQYRNHGSS